MKRDFINKRAINQQGTMQVSFIFGEDSRQTIGDFYGKTIHFIKRGAARYIV
jgi:hypothetical protein